MEMWHVLNRGVDKRAVVLDDSDRFRFVHDMFAFNDVGRVDENHRNPRWKLAAHEREILVHIHAWCLMNNHYHLLLSEARTDGIPEFLKKLNMGYAKYFNEKYERTGSLWQGKTKKILIERDAHFLHIPLYIHLNPLDMSLPQWRRGAVTDPTKALAKLETYRWSSHRDYLGEKNFPSVISHQHTKLFEGFDTRHRYEKRLRDVIFDTDIATRSALLE